MEVTLDNRVTGPGGERVSGADGDRVLHPRISTRSATRPSITPLRFPASRWRTTRILGRDDADDDNTPPQLSEEPDGGISVRGTQLTLVYNENLDENSIPDTTAYTVQCRWQEFATVDRVDVVTTTVTLTLALVTYEVGAGVAVVHPRDQPGPGHSQGIQPVRWSGWRW